MAASAELTQYGIEIKAPIWRVVRARFEPMDVPPLEVQGTGRFDDAQAPAAGETDSFGVLYCGSTPYAAFLETLHLHRRQLDEVQKVSDSTMIDVEMRDEFMRRYSNQGLLPNDWQVERQISSANIVTIAPVFDLTNPAAVQLIREQLALTLLALGYDDLDFASLLSRKRDVTQAISRWIWSLTNDHGEPLFSGIRYRSRFDPECICLALYQDRYDVDGNIDIQPITPETPGFDAAAKTLRLKIS